MNQHAEANRPLFFALAPLVCAVAAVLLLPSLLGLGLAGLGLFGFAGIAGLIWSWLRLRRPVVFGQHARGRILLLVCGCMIAPLGMWLALGALQHRCGGRPMGAGALHWGLCCLLYVALAIFFFICEGRIEGWRPKRPASGGGAVALVAISWAISVLVLPVPWNAMDDYVDAVNAVCDMSQAEDESMQAAGL